jgi:hypothetical protein
MSRLTQMPIGPDIDPAPAIGANAKPLPVHDKIYLFLFHPLHLPKEKTKWQTNNQ